MGRVNGPLLLLLLPVIVSTSTAVASLYQTTIIYQMDEPKVGDIHSTRGPR